MPKRKPSRTDHARKPKRTGRQARAGRQTLRSEKIGALPILNHLIEQLRLEEFLREFLPLEDKRVKIPARKALLVLLRNLLIAREPLYGIGPWAAGYRLLWYHSARKAELDGLARATRLQRATRELDELRQRLTSPRTRYRTRSKVTEAFEAILKSREVDDWIIVAIEDRTEEHYRQEGRGRPTKDTKYRKEVSTRFDLTYHFDHPRIAEDQQCDGVFPLITNDDDLSEQEVLLVYKRQPVIEKRFSQLKTDFGVTPVYLKDVSRIQALLCVYFLVLLVEALLERELRRAMEREKIESLPLYPEDRPCRRPTARRVIDLFDDIYRHTLNDGSQAPTVFVTELSDLQRRILKLLGVPPTEYRG